MSFALSIPRPPDALSEDAAMAGRAVGELRRQAGLLRAGMLLSAALACLAAAGALILLVRWLAWGGAHDMPSFGELWSVAFPLAGYLALRLAQRAVTLARAAAYVRRALAEIAEREARAA